MQQHNIDKLEKYRPKLAMWVNDQTCHLDGIAKQEILDVIRAEFDPGYTVDAWCGPCVVKMLVYAFKRMDESRVHIILPQTDIPKGYNPEGKTEIVTVPLIKQKKKWH